MDVNTLLQCFSGTLNHDSVVRNNSEAQLKDLSKNPGFLGACLDIISTEGIPSNIKLSASLYFKNKITYGWTGQQYGKNELLDYSVDNDEKPVVKSMLINALVSSSTHTPSCIRLLHPALTLIVGQEYPQKNWNNLLQESFQLISSDDINSSHIGLLCLSEIFRTYRWKTNDDRQDLELLIVQCFPDLLKYTESLIQSDNSMEIEKVGEMVKLVLKIYKFVTYHDLPFTLQRSENVIPWVNFHVMIIQYNLPYQLELSNKNISSNSSWLKAKKWAYSNLYRLFQRYASESLTKKFAYEEFKTLYVNQFIPQLLQLFFQQIENWGNQTLWLSDEAISLILNFIEQTIIQRETWDLVKPHYNVILEHVIFPLLCPTEHTLYIFDSEPQEYIHRNMELWDNDYSPDLAAISLLTTAVHKHPKTTLSPTIQFVIQILQNNISDFKSISLEHAIKLESALRIVSNIIDRLIHRQSPYLNEMENFLHAYVFPFFSSNYGFLRARVCELCSKLDGFEFCNPTTLPTIYEGVMMCFNEETDCLPVKLLASLAIQTFVNVPEFQESLSAIAVPVMKKLLQLSNEFESDAISGVMQEFVECFSTELQPFGVDLMNNLVQQFLKLAIELNEASNFNINTSISMDSAEIPDETDKQMAALGMLSTTISILLSFENSHEIVRNLEQFFYPAAEFILRNNLEDFYREACEFVENSTFLLRDISPISWKFLELIGECNKHENGMVSFYLSDFMLAINNYLVYGKEELKKNQFYSRILFEIYSKAAKNEENDLDEISAVFDLSQKIILTLGDAVPQNFLEEFLQDSVKIIISEQDQLKEKIVFGVTSFNVILSCIVKFPLETLKFLQLKNILDIFFNIWIDFYGPNYTRVYDNKLSILALLSILSHLSLHDCTSLLMDNIYSRLGSFLSNLLIKYPIALKSLDEKRKEYSSNSTNLDSFNDVDDWDEFNDNDNSIEDEQEYLDFLKNETRNLEFINKDKTSFNQEDFDDLEEDPLSGSILDDINIYDVFKSVFNSMKETDIKKYQTIMSSLKSDDQAQFTHIISM